MKSVIARANTAAVLVSLLLLRGAAAAVATDNSTTGAKCCDPTTGPGGCPDENGSFDNCWDEGGYCCSDGKWYADPGDGSGNCQDKQLEDSESCAALAATTSLGVPDIMCVEGDSLGNIGLECIDDATYEGTELTCGPDGSFVQAEKVFTCPDSVPHCVQCGPRGEGNALCLPTPAADEDCGEEGVDNAETDPTTTSEPPIFCPGGQNPIPETSCDRGPNRTDCGDGEYCFVDPSDRFAVCCPGSIVELPWSGGSIGGTCASDEDCTATVRSRFPNQTSVGVSLCQCYARSSVDPFDECQGETDSTCGIAKCTPSCDGLEGYCTLPRDSVNGTKMCALRPTSSDNLSKSPTVVPIAMSENVPASTASPTDAPTSSAASFRQGVPNTAKIHKAVIVATILFGMFS